MEVNYINYFNEFEREYEVLKNASDDVLTVSLEIIHYIEKKLKEMFEWLKKQVFETLQEEIYFFYARNLKLSNYFFFLLTSSSLM